MNRTSNTPTEDTPAIAAQGLGKDYGNRTVVQSLDFQVRQGEVFGLLGPNGAGKTTTILMLLGLTEATRGQVRVLGEDPWRNPLAVKRRIGYMPDSVGFYDHLSARDNLRYTARLLGIPADTRDARIAAALGRVQLADRIDQRVGTFSHGMRRRLGLAEILLKQAAIAILDEPTSGLDPQSTESFLRLIESLREEGVTVLLSSHLLDQMQRICDRVALFNAGRIALMGPVQALARQVLGGHSHEVRIHAEGPDLISVLGAVPGVGQVRAEPGGHYILQAESDVRAQAAQAAVLAGAELHDLSVDTPSLDRIYRQTFSKDIPT
ncbi:ABC transporter ATP-binding protein [Castellaniella sp.]|uniref:ABC transporter ATP-binding protein n=1 Tax=Castellaniella sp. TaxID=1955812 RepID=UPI002AFED88A|nr:ABC transporter ATP-binding protein [Castellaniella sp.]